MTLPDGTPAAAYGRLEAEHAAAFDAAKKRSFRLGTVRAATFLALSAALVLFDVLEGGLEMIALGVSAVLFVAFVAEVVVHRRVRREQDWHEVMADLTRQGSFRLNRAWSDLEASLPGRERTAPEAEGHPFAHDLALLGPASLSRLLGPITSEPGRRTVTEWLLTPASPGDAAERALGAREWAPRLDDRLAFAAHGRLAKAGDPAALDRFLRWAGRESWILRKKWTLVGAWVLPALLVSSAVADFFFGAPPLWLLPALPQLYLLRKVTRRVEPDFKAVELLAPALGAYVPQMREVSSWSAEAPVLTKLLERLASVGRPAHEVLAALGRLVDTVGSRRNLVYGVLAPVFLLDVHLAVRLDRWRRAHGRRAVEWLSALGEIEAMCGLASLTFDHPDWAFPEWQGGDAARVTGTRVGHPLLPPGACVRNDVTVGPPGRFTLVTGSNMSGKSTLLRSIGTNVVLAGAGAPVCAESFRLPKVRVRTSMSIEDSLSTGVSLFMAQLLRVRDIVAEAQTDGGQDGPVLYLLDEMLHGTNSAERRIAARAVLRHLLEHAAIGAVSTHDLSLADAEDLRAAADPVHFRETVHRDGQETHLDFDYLMRPGLAQTSNALVLLEAVGLDPAHAPHGEREGVPGR